MPAPHRFGDIFAHACIQKLTQIFIITYKSIIPPSAFKLDLGGFIHTLTLHSKSKTWSLARILYCLNTMESVVEKVENGLYISVDYKGILQNGEVFDTSQGSQPLEVQMGNGQLIEGFERELVGMSLNDRKKFTLSPEDAYGQRDESLTREFARADFPSDIDPKVGMTIALQTPEGRRMPAQITHLDEEKLSVDLNHPLAGEALTFEIEVVGISKTPNQSRAGCRHGSGCDCDSDNP
jgi:peptidylprolyl isomerase